MRNLFQFLQNLAVGWFIPLLVAAIVFPFLQIVVFINRWVGEICIVAIAGILTFRTIRQEQWWQMIVWALIFLPAALLAFLSPFYFQLWILLLQILVLILLLGVPGIVLPSTRGLLSGVLVCEVVLTLFLSGFTILSSSGISVSPHLVIVILLLIISSVIFFLRSARPYEVRHVQRRFSYWTLRIAILLLVGTLMWPLIRGITFAVSGHDPELERVVVRTVVQSKQPIKKIFLSPNGTSTTIYTGDYRPLIDR